MWLLTVYDVLYSVVKEFKEMDPDLWPQRNYREFGNTIWSQQGKDTHVLDT